MDWCALIDTASGRRPAPIKAEEYLGTLRHLSWRPVKMHCSDKMDYAVKALGIAHDNLPAGRTMFNENVASRLGTLICAPVPQAALVSVSQQLIDQNEEMQPRLPGLAHGSRFIENCKGAEPKKHEILYQNEGNNRARFSRLAIFLGWTNGSNTALINDAEFIYNRDSHKVYCIDFGNFFGGPAWTELTQLQSEAVPNAYVKDKCHLNDDELAKACKLLRTVTPEQIAEAVAAPPEEWRVRRDQRVELARLLYKRHGELVKANAADGETGGETIFR